MIVPVWTNLLLAAKSDDAAQRSAAFNRAYEAAGTILPTTDARRGAGHPKPDWDLVRRNLRSSCDHSLMSAALAARHVANGPFHVGPVFAGAAVLFFAHAADLVGGNGRRWRSRLDELTSAWVAGGTATQGGASSTPARATASWHDVIGSSQSDASRGRMDAALAAHRRLIRELSEEFGNDRAEKATLNCIAELARVRGGRLDKITWNAFVLALNLRNLVQHNEFPVEPGLALLGALAVLCVQELRGQPTLPNETLLLSASKHGVLGLPLALWPSAARLQLVSHISDSGALLGLCGAAIRSAYLDGVGFVAGCLSGPGGPHSLRNTFVEPRLVALRDEADSNERPSVRGSRLATDATDPLTTRADGAQPALHALGEPAWGVIGGHDFNVAIIGEAGSGKSALLSYLAWRCATEAGLPLPLLLSAQDLRLTPDGRIDLLGWAARGMERFSPRVRDVLPDALPAWIEQDSVVLLIDDLDSVSTGDARTLAGCVAEMPGRVRVVVAARELTALDPLRDSLRLRGPYRIAPLSEGEARRLVDGIVANCTMGPHDVDGPGEATSTGLPKTRHRAADVWARLVESAEGRLVAANPFLLRCAVDSAMNSPSDRNLNPFSLVASAARRALRSACANSKQAVATERWLEHAARTMIEVGADVLDVTSVVAPDTTGAGSTVGPPADDQVEWQGLYVVTVREGQLRFSHEVFRDYFAGGWLARCLRDAPDYAGEWLSNLLTDGGAPRERNRIITGVPRVIRWTTARLSSSSAASTLIAWLERHDDVLLRATLAAAEGASAIGLMDDDRTAAPTLKVVFDVVANHVGAMLRDRSVRAGWSGVSLMVRHGGYTETWRFFRRALERRSEQEVPLGQIPASAELDVFQQSPTPEGALLLHDLGILSARSEWARQALDLAPELEFRVAADLISRDRTLSPARLARYFASESTSTRIQALLELRRYRVPEAVDELVGLLQEAARTAKPGFGTNLVAAMIALEVPNPAGVISELIEKAPSPTEAGCHAAQLAVLPDELLVGSSIARLLARPGTRRLFAGDPVVQSLARGDLVGAWRGMWRTNSVGQEDEPGFASTATPFLLLAIRLATSEERKQLRDDCDRRLRNQKPERRALALMFRIALSDGIAWDWVMKMRSVKNRDIGRELRKMIVALSKPSDLSHFIELMRAPDSTTDARIAGAHGCLAHGLREAASDIEKLTNDDATCYAAADVLDQLECRSPLGAENLAGVIRDPACGDGVRAAYMRRLLALDRSIGIRVAGETLRLADRDQGAVPEEVFSAALELLADAAPQDLELRRLLARRIPLWAPRKRAHKLRDWVLIGPNALARNDRKERRGAERLHWALVALRALARMGRDGLTEDEIAAVVDVVWYPNSQIRDAAFDVVVAWGNEGATRIIEDGLRSNMLSSDQALAAFGRLGEWESGARRAAEELVAAEFKRRRGPSPAFIAVLAEQPLWVRGWVLDGVRSSRLRRWLGLRAGSRRGD